MAKGINVRCSEGELVFDAFLQDAAGNLVNSGNTYFRLYRVISASGTIESFDWSDAIFKQSALTTENLSASHRKGNNSTRDTGLWITRLSNLGNFNKGDICYLQVDNTYASPKIQTQKFQFGSAEGDMTVNPSGFLNVNVNNWMSSVPEILQTGMVHSWSTNTGSSSSGSSDVNVVSWGGTSVSPLIAGRMDSYVSQIATNAIDANSLNSDVATEINSGMPTLSDLLSLSGKFNNLSVNVSGWRGIEPAVLNSNRVNVYVEDMATNVINSNVLATSAITEIQDGLSRQSDIISISGLIQSPSNVLNVNITGWLGLPPLSLVNGRINTYVGDMATNIINSNVLDSSAITEIQTGLATNSSLLSISGKFDNLSVNVSGWRGELPAILNSARVNVYVEDMATNVINSNALASSAVSEIQTGLATNSDVISLSGKFNNLSVNVSGWRGLQPNNLQTGRIDSYVGAMAIDVFDSSVLATSAVTEIQNGLAKQSDIISISGLIQSPTGLLNVNVIQWSGQSVSPLISGNIPSRVVSYSSGEIPLKGIVETRRVDVTSSGTIGINWGNIENKTSRVLLTNTSISGVDNSVLGTVNANVIQWLGSGVNNLVSGYMPSIIQMYASGQVPLKPTVENRTLDVTSNGNAGIDWSNIDNPTSPVNLVNTSISGVNYLNFTNISVNVSGWKGLSPNALQNGRVDSSVGAMATDVLNATALASDAVTEIQNGLAKQSDIISISGYLTNLDVAVSTRLAPTNSGRTLDVSVGGEAGIDWSNIGNQNANVNLSNTAISGVNYLSINNISVNVSGWRGLAPNALQNGRVDAYVGVMGTDVLNATALATDAVTEIQNGLSTTSQILSISGYLPRLDVNVSTRLAPSVTGRTLDVTVSGTTGINWGNIENPTKRNLLTNTSISGIDNFVSGIFDANVVKWRGEVPDVLATGMVHSYIDGLTGNTDVNVISWAGVSVSPLISGLLQVLVNDYNVGKWPLQPIVDNTKIDVSTSGYVGIFANLDKQNYILGPSGLDYILITHPTGVASNYREMNIQTWRRFFKKTTLNAASGIITFDDNDTTIITRQAVSDNGTTQTQFSS